MHSAPGGGPLPTPLVEISLFAVATGLSLLLGRFTRLLVIPALLLGGVAFGPGGLGLLQDPLLLEGASDVGMVLLLFYTSLFAHPRALREGGRVALPLAGYDLVLNVAAAYWIGALFHLDVPSRLVLAGVLATSSTGAILKILSDEGRLLRREGTVLLALLWIEDLAFIVYYLFLNHALGGPGGFLRLQTLLGLLLFLGYLCLVGLLREAIWGIRSREVLIPLLTGIGVLGAYLGGLGGLPAVASAFATGLVASGSRGAQFVQTEAPYVRDIAAAIFFFAFGALLDPHVARGALPLAATALGTVLVTELLFLPQVGRLLGLTSLEAHVVGGSLLARGGKSAAFARLGAESPAGVPHAAEIQGVSGILTVLLTPLAPLLVRIGLRLRRAEPRSGRVPHSREVLSRLTRRVLTPAPFAQRNLVPWSDRAALVGWFVLVLELGLLASLLPFPARLAPALLGLALLGPAFYQARDYFERTPGSPATSHEHRRKATPRLEAFLPLVLLLPFLLVVALPLVAPQAVVAYPAAAAVLLLVLLLLPRLVHPRARAPRFERALAH